VNGVKIPIANPVKNAPITELIKISTFKIRSPVVGSITDFVSKKLNNTRAESIIENKLKIKKLMLFGFS